jgi:hypothetical protein
MQLVVTEGVFGPCFTLEGKRVEHFPLSRPIDMPVHVFDANAKYLGMGQGVMSRITGGCILIMGKKYDSNDNLFWQYVETTPDFNA